MIVKTNRSTDVVIKLKVKDGEKAKNTLGTSDPRLFTGENNIHAIMDTQVCLWHLKMEHGLLPKEFNQQFTSFSKLINFVRDYYDRRNVEVEEIID